MLAALAMEREIGLTFRKHNMHDFASNPASNTQYFACSASLAAISLTCSAKRFPFSNLSCSSAPQCLNPCTFRPVSQSRNGASMDHSVVL